MRPSHRFALAVALLGAMAWTPARDSRLDGGSIERIASLETSRAAHSATALENDRLLVAGGMDAAGGSLRSAELVDLARASVRALPSLGHARAGHTATALSDGRVVLAGGYDGGYVRSVEVFDPARERFEELGELYEGRSGHTATLLADGRILIAGGVGREWTFLSTAELFDPESGSSETVGALGVPRESHTATLLADGRVLVVGGHRGRREGMEVYASAEIYVPATRSFTPTGALETARHKHDAVLLADGRVLVLGGADRTDRRYFETTELFDPTSGSFSMGPPMENSRYKFQGTAVRLRGGDVLVASGARTAELFDGRALAFRAVDGGFPEAYYFATATGLASGDVAIIGGYGDGNRTTDGVWRFRSGVPDE